MADNLPREFLHERDARIFALKKSGLSNQDIAKRFDMTAAAVAAATRRQLNRLNSEAFLSYPEVLRLELERLDEMQKSLWLHRNRSATGLPREDPDCPYALPWQPCISI